MVASATHASVPNTGMRVFDDPQLSAFGGGIEVRERQTFVRTPLAYKKASGKSNAP